MVWWGLESVKNSFWPTCSSQVHVYYLFPPPSILSRPDYEHTRHMHTHPETAQLGSDNKA